MEPGQGIRLGVPRTGAVGQGEVKPVKEKGPPGLSGVEALRHPEVLQVAMVRPDEEWVLRSPAGGAIPPTPASEPAVPGPPRRTLPPRAR